MPDQLPDVIINRGLPAALAVVDLVRRQVQALARRDGGRSDPDRLLAQARKIVARAEPLLARTLRDSLLLSWIEAAKKAAPPAPPPESTPLFSTAPPDLRPPFGPTTAFAEPEPVVRFPQLEAGAKDLAERHIVTAEQFAELAQDAERTAFTVARLGSVDAIAKVREAVLEDLRDGGTLDEFREKISGAIAGSGLGEGHVEAIYRTSVAQAYGAGQRAILENPLVNDAFPYVMWSATHDSRTRPDHLLMETHGQNGTAVYRLDDPIWMTLWPPAGWNCRCHVIPLSIEDAAKHGSHEAKRWLETGEPPMSPVFAATPYPIKLPTNWPSNGSIASVI